MTFEEWCEKADINGATVNYWHIKSAYIFGLNQLGPGMDSWLTLAHIICSDQGIPPGHIMARLEQLRDKLDDDLK
jgi:hypothetical protein